MIDRFSRSDCSKGANLDKNYEKCFPPRTSGLKINIFSNKVSRTDEYYYLHYVRIEFSI